jgi:hypothetical protein
MTLASSLVTSHRITSPLGFAAARSSLITFTTEGEPQSRSSTRSAVSGGATIRR